jgi:polyhydroxyalkanoate synthesis regulator phasin
LVIRRSLGHVSTKPTLCSWPPLATLHAYEILMKRKTILLVAVLVVVISAAGFFYYRYVSSPEYSLGQILSAYKEHDLTKFEKYVDSKTMVGGLLDKAMNEVSAKSSANNEAERLGENLGIGLINLMRPQVEELWTQQINRLVETGEIQGEKGKAGLEELWNKSDTASFQGIREIIEDGKVATISLEFNQPRFDTTLVLNVKMRDKGSYWQLFDISNAFDYGTALESLEERRVNRENEEIKKQFFTYIKMSDVKLKTVVKGYYSKWYGHTYLIDFENIGDKDISTLTCFFDINGSSGQKLETGYINNQINLRPGQRYSHKEEDVMSYDKIDPNGMTVNISLAELKFDDGSKLEWQYKWADLAKGKK